MTCREKVISEDYADILLDYVLPPELLALSRVDYCYTRIEGNLDDLSIQPLTYREIPSCYGLMAPAGVNMDYDYDPSVLINSGILSVQREPLSLTGRGVTMAFIDIVLTSISSPYEG